MSDNDNEPSEEGEQGALFEIGGPDEDGCVWINFPDLVVNLGPRDAVAEKLADWFAQMDYGEAARARAIRAIRANRSAQVN